MPYRLSGLNMGKPLAIGAGSVLSVFAPVKSLLFIALLFVVVDFVFGLIVSIRVRKQGVMSSKIYNTIWKAIGIEVSIFLAFLLDTQVLENTTAFHLENIFTGIVCGTELWSILTHFAILSNHPVFRLIKKWGKSEIENKVGALKGFEEEVESGGQEHGA
jgi:phage-related holin